VLPECGYLFSIVFDIIKTEITMSALKNSGDTYLNQPFKDLKKILKKKKKKNTTVPLETEKDKSPGDSELFTEAMKEVQEIREFREIPLYHKPADLSCYGRSSDHEVLKALEEIVDRKRPVHLPDTPEYIEWINQDYRDDLARKLHEGRYSVQDCLDLHGRVVEEAKAEVEYFLKVSVGKGYKCVKIIHGRGLRSPNGPVLKGAVVKWLLTHFRKYIAAFVTARQCDGGLGALYVLLK
jgi:DNA-nicking Smr family endonuclease